MEMTDPRRAKIAEAMEAHDGAEQGEWHNECVVGHGENYHGPGHWVNSERDAVGECWYEIDARSIALSHNALPDAVELIDELTAEVNAWKAIAQTTNPEATKNSEQVIARFEEMTAEIERHKAEKLHLIRQLQSVARHSAEHGTKSRVSVALSEVNYD